MKIHKKLALWVLALAAGLCVSSVATPARAAEAPRLGKASLKEVVAAMTLEEKASLVVGTGLRAIPVSDAAGMTYAIPRLGIPPLILADGPAGLRISPTRDNDSATYFCTAFPVSTLLASTWDPGLAREVGQAMGNEVREYGVDILLAPALNIHRNPLCGRNFEYYSEDPYLTGKMAAGVVSGVQSQGVGTSIKHFAANNAETDRTTLDTLVSERALREIYLEGFRRTVEEARPWTVMSSYNLINGVYTSERHDLLTSILGQDWGFKGFVMSDWGGGRDVVAQMAAGNDLIMPGGPEQVRTIVTAVKDGKLDIEVLDRNVARILNIILRSPAFKGYKPSNAPDLESHARLARRAAAEGMVLLKNNGALPLGREVKTIAAFGNASYETIIGGTGSGEVNEAYVVSLVEGLRKGGWTVSENLEALYAAYLKAVREGRPKPKGEFFAPQSPPAEMGITADLADSLANAADIAVITIGRNSGEGRDRSSGEGDFKLTAVERDLLRSVSAAFQAKGKKAVVILNIAGVVETASWRDLPDAILLAWQGGQETGNSVSDILGGKVDPCGRLATTFPVDYKDVPSSGTFPGVEVPADPSASPSPAEGFGWGKPAVVTYEDGVYVGYRYYETFLVKPAYEFGYGMSYTRFTYGDLKLSSSRFHKTMTASMEVRNTGSVAGREVVQLYLSAPAGALDKPALELKGFIKTRLLQPGESQTVIFALDERSLSSFDPRASAWIAAAGAYEVKVGASSRDIRRRASFSLAQRLRVKKESVSLVPKTRINELKPQPSSGPRPEARSF